MFNNRKKKEDLEGKAVNGIEEPPTDPKRKRSKNKKRFYLSFRKKQISQELETKGSEMNESEFLKGESENNNDQQTNPKMRIEIFSSEDEFGDGFEGLEIEENVVVDEVEEEKVNSKKKINSQPTISVEPEKNSHLCVCSEEKFNDSRKPNIQIPIETDLMNLKSPKELYNEMREKSMENEILIRESEEETVSIEIFMGQKSPETNDGNRYEGEEVENVDSKPAEIVVTEGSRHNNTHKGSLISHEVKTETRAIQTTINSVTEAKSAILESSKILNDELGEVSTEKELEIRESKEEEAKELFLKEIVKEEKPIEGKHCKLKDKKIPIAAPVLSKVVPETDFVTRAVEKDVRIQAKKGVRNEIASKEESLNEGVLGSEKNCKDEVERISRDFENERLEAQVNSHKKNNEVTIENITNRADVSLYTGGETNKEIKFEEEKEALEETEQILGTNEEDGDDSQSEESSLSEVSFFNNNIRNEVSDEIPKETKSSRMRKGSSSSRTSFIPAWGVHNTSRPTEDTYQSESSFSEETIEENHDEVTSMSITEPKSPTANEDLGGNAPFSAWKAASQDQQEEKTPCEQEKKVHSREGGYLSDNSFLKNQNHETSPRSVMETKTSMASDACAHKPVPVWKISPPGQFEDKMLSKEEKKLLPRESSCLSDDSSSKESAEKSHPVNPSFVAETKNTTVPAWKIASRDFRQKYKTANNHLETSRAAIVKSPARTERESLVSSPNKVPAWKIASRDFRQKYKTTSLEKVNNENTTRTTTKSPVRTRKETSPNTQLPAWKIASRDFRQKPKTPSNMAFGHSLTKTESRVPLQPKKDDVTTDTSESQPIIEYNEMARPAEMPMSKRNQKLMQLFLERQKVGREEHAKKTNAVLRR